MSPNGRNPGQKIIARDSLYTVLLALALCICAVVGCSTVQDKQVKNRKEIITAVDSKNSLAEISVGSAYGVKEDMKFLVTRGNEFICHILILDVNDERAVGIFEFGKKMPKVGDYVTALPQVTPQPLTKKDIGWMEGPLRGQVSEVSRLGEGQYTKISQGFWPRGRITISIGSDDGVKQGMRFAVDRIRRKLPYVAAETDWPVAIIIIGKVYPNKADGSLYYDKTIMEAQLGSDLLPKVGDRVREVFRPVTPEEAVDRPAPPVTKALGLKGLVTAVDQKNSKVEISIGSAHGVKENMKFHVTRGDEFICDVLILNVDAEKAVGILDLVKKMPKVGDNIGTNL